MFYLFATNLVVAAFLATVLHFVFYLKKKMLCQCYFQRIFHCILVTRLIFFNVRKH